MATASELLDLDPELMLHALEFLQASDQARVSQVCKLFAILIDEIEQAASFMAGAVGPLGGLVGGSLKARLEARPTMGILFSKEALGGRDALAGLAKQVPYHAEIVGGHMSVVAGTDAAGALVQTNSVCPHARGQGSAEDVGLMLGRFPEATVQSFAVDTTAQHDWRAALEAQGAFEAGWKVFLLVARDRDTASIVTALQTAHPKAAIIGGMATGELLYRVRRGTVEQIQEGIVGLMFAGEVPLAAFVSRGARGLGEAACHFSEGDLREVPRDADDPDEPLQILTHVQHPSGERCTALSAAIDCVQQAGRAGLLMGLADPDAPEDGFELHGIDNDRVVRSEEALLLPRRRGDEPLWPSGSVRFYSFDPESCREDLASRLRAVKANAERQGQRMLGAVMFTCGGRTHNFFGESAFDATTFTRTFEGVPLIGMYAGGEIGPPLRADASLSRAFQVGGASMHGFTAVFGLFILPERKPRASVLGFADASEVAAAYAEVRRHAKPVPPPPSVETSSAASLRELLPASLPELRALPVKVLKQAMQRLGLSAVPGSEKEDLVQELHAKMEAGRA